MNVNSNKQKPDYWQYSFKVGMWQRIYMKKKVMTADFRRDFEKLLVDIETSHINGDGLSKASQKTLQQLRQREPKKYEQLVKKAQLEFKVADQVLLGDAFRNYFTTKYSCKRTLSIWRQTFRKLTEGFPYDAKMVAGDSKLVFGIDPSTPVDKVRAQDVERLYMELKTKGGFAEYTLYKEKKNVKQFFKHLKDTGVTEINPLEEIQCKLAKQAKAAKKAYITPEDFKLVLDGFHSSELQQQTLFAYYRLMGARQMEPVMDQWEDCDFVHRTINRWDNKSKERLGDCPIPELLYGLLTRWRDQVVQECGKARGPIFPWLNEREGRGALVWNYFEDRIRRVGMEPWANLFNSMRASRSREIRRMPNGELLESKWLGHTDMTALESYDDTMAQDYDIVRKDPLWGGGEAA